MKTSKIFFGAMLALACATVFVGCKKDDDGTDPITPTPTPTGDTDTLTVAQAIEKVNGLAANAYTDKAYYIKGYVTGLKEAIDLSYGNVTFYMADAKGEQQKSDLYCYRLSGFGGKKIDNTDFLKKDDLVIVYGYLQNYMGNTPEIPQKGPDGSTYNYVYSVNGKTKNETVDGGVKTIAEAIEIANALAAGGKTKESYTCSGVVDTVFTQAADITKYGNINFRLKDGDDEIACFYTNYLNDVKFTSADQIPAKGTKVTICGPLKKYVKGEQTTPEFENAYFVKIGE